MLVGFGRGIVTSLFCQHYDSTTAVNMYSIEINPIFFVPILSFEFSI